MALPRTLDAFEFDEPAEVPAPVVTRVNRPGKAPVPMVVAPQATPEDPAEQVRAEARAARLAAMPPEERLKVEEGAAKLREGTEIPNWSELSARAQDAQPLDPEEVRKAQLPTDLVPDGAAPRGVLPDRQNTPDVTGARTVDEPEQGLGALADRALGLTKEEAKEARGARAMTALTPEERVFSTRLRRSIDAEQGQPGNKKASFAAQEFLERYASWYLAQHPAPDGLEHTSDEREAASQRARAALFALQQGGVWGYGNTTGADVKLAKGEELTGEDYLEALKPRGTLTPSGQSVNVQDPVTYAMELTSVPISAAAEVYKGTLGAVGESLGLKATPATDPDFYAALRERKGFSDILVDGKEDIPLIKAIQDKAKEPGVEGIAAAALDWALLLNAVAIDVVAPDATDAVGPVGEALSVAAKAAKLDAAYKAAKVAAGMSDVAGDEAKALEAAKVAARKALSQKEGARQIEGIAKAGDDVTRRVLEDRLADTLAITDSGRAVQKVMEGKTPAPSPELVVTLAEKRIAADAAFAPVSAEMSGYKDDWKRLKRDLITTIEATPPGGVSKPQGSMDEALADVERRVQALRPEHTKARRAAEEARVAHEAVLTGEYGRAYQKASEHTARGLDDAGQAASRATDIQPLKTPPPRVESLSIADEALVGGKVNASALAKLLGADGSKLAAKLGRPPTVQDAVREALRVGGEDTAPMLEKMAADIVESLRDTPARDLLGNLDKPRGPNKRLLSNTEKLKRLLNVDEEGVEVAVEKATELIAKQQAELARAQLRATQRSTLAAIAEAERAESALQKALQVARTEDKAAIRQKLADAKTLLGKYQAAQKVTRDAQKKLEKAIGSLGDILPPLDHAPGEGPHPAQELINASALDPSMTPEEEALSDMAQALPFVLGESKKYTPAPGAIQAAQREAQYGPAEDLVFSRTHLPFLRADYIARAPTDWAPTDPAHFLKLALDRDVEATNRYIHGADPGIQDFARNHGLPGASSKTPKRKVGGVYVQPVGGAPEFVRYETWQNAQRLGGRVDYQHASEGYQWTEEGQKFWDALARKAAETPDLPPARGLNEYFASLLPWSDPYARPEDVDKIRLYDTVSVRNPEISKQVGPILQQVRMTDGAGNPIQLANAETGRFTGRVIGYKNGMVEIQPLEAAKSHGDRWRVGAHKPVLVPVEDTLYVTRGRDPRDITRRRRGTGEKYADFDMIPRTNARWKAIGLEEQKMGAPDLRYADKSAFHALNPPKQPDARGYAVPWKEWGELQKETVRKGIPTPTFQQEVERAAKALPPQDPGVIEARKASAIREAAGKAGREAAGVPVGPFQRTRPEKGNIFTAVENAENEARAVDDAIQAKAQAAGQEAETGDEWLDAFKGRRTNPARTPGQEAALQAFIQERIQAERRVGLAQEGKGPVGPRDAELIGKRGADLAAAFQRLQEAQNMQTAQKALAPSLEKALADAKDTRRPVLDKAFERLIANDEAVDIAKMPAPTGEVPARSPENTQRELDWIREQSKRDATMRRETFGYRRARAKENRKRYFGKFSDDNEKSLQPQVVRMVRDLETTAAHIASQIDKELRQPGLKDPLKALNADTRQAFFEALDAGTDSRLAEAAAYSHLDPLFVPALKGTPHEERLYKALRGNRTWGETEDLAQVNARLQEESRKVATALTLNQLSGVEVPPKLAALSIDEMLRDPVAGTAVLATQAGTIAAQHRFLEAAEGIGAVVSKEEADRIALWYTGGPGADRGRAAALRVLTTPHGYDTPLDDVKEMFLASTANIQKDRTAALNPFDKLGEVSKKGRGSAVGVAEEALQALDKGPPHMPRAVKDRLEALVNASLKAGTPYENELQNWWKAGRTTGIYRTHPAHFIGNLYGDFDQMATEAGLGVAARQSARNFAQHFLAVPGVANATLVADRFKTLAKGTTLDRVSDFLAFGTIGKGVRDVMEAAPGKTIKLGKKDYGAEDLWKIGMRHHVGDTFSSEVLQQGVSDLMRKRSPPFRWLADQREVVQKAAHTIAARQRWGMYLTLIDSGMDPEKAAEATTRALLDYKGTLHPIDKHMIVGVFHPFWAFEKSNALRVAQGMLNPAAWGKDTWRTPWSRARQGHEVKEKVAQGLTALLDDRDDAGYQTKDMDPEQRAAYDAALKTLLAKGWTNKLIKDVLTHKHGLAVEARRLRPGDQEMIDAAEALDGFSTEYWMVNPGGDLIDEWMKGRATVYWQGDKQGEAAGQLLKQAGWTAAPMGEDANFSGMGIPLALAGTLYNLGKALRGAATNDPTTAVAFQRAVQAAASKATVGDPTSQAMVDVVMAMLGAYKHEEYYVPGRKLTPGIGAALQGVSPELLARQDKTTGDYSMPGVSGAVVDATPLQDLLDTMTLSETLLTGEGKTALDGRLQQMLGVRTYDASDETAAERQDADANANIRYATKKYPEKETTLPR